MLFTLSDYLYTYERAEAGVKLRLSDTISSKSNLRTKASYEADMTPRAYRCAAVPFSRRAAMPPTRYATDPLCLDRSGHNNNIQ